MKVRHVLLGMVPTVRRPALVLVAATNPIRRAERIALIEQAGHRVIEAIDGVHALASAARHLPDIAIVDVVMSKLDGVQLTARFASNPDMRDTPTILVRDSGSDMESHDDVHPVVASEDELMQHLHRLLAARTTQTEQCRTLRRALADIRAAAQGSHGDAVTQRDLARQIASGTAEAMISVLVADDNARYVEANSAICALTGYPREKLLEMSIWDLSAEDVVERGQRAWKRFLRDGRYEGSYRIRRSTGEPVTIRCSSAANIVPGLHVSTMAPPRLLHALRT
jgi:PAS domain S-box-containing protein